MPKYKFNCENCGANYEFSMSYSEVEKSDWNVKHCEKCNKLLKQVITIPTLGKGISYIKVCSTKKAKLGWKAIDREQALKHGEKPKNE